MRILPEVDLFLLSAHGVLWFVIWSVLLFVVAPHLEVFSKPAARTVRLGSFAALLQPVVPAALYFARFEHELIWTLGPVLGVVFWGSLAFAARQLVQGAPPKSGMLS